MSPTLLEFVVLLGLGVLLAAYSWALYKTVRAQKTHANPANTDVSEVPETAKSISAGEGEVKHV